MTAARRAHQFVELIVRQTQPGFVVAAFEVDELSCLEFVVDDGFNTPSVPFEVAGQTQRNRHHGLHGQIERCGRVAPEAALSQGRVCSGARASASPTHGRIRDMRVGARDAPVAAYDGCWVFPSRAAVTETEFAALRGRMVAEIAAHTIFLTGRLDKAALNRRVMDAMAKVPRHAFVRLELQPLAYADTPLPSGYGKTISQPFIVALMTDLLDLQPSDIVLEVGTGLGYQTALLAELAMRVYSGELIEELAADARRRLARQGYANVEVRTGDGRAGWPEQAPFDKIIVSAAPELVPASLLYQLKPGGKMVTPAGLPDAQQLLLVQKDRNGTLSTREVLPVRFSLLEAVAQA